MEFFAVGITPKGCKHMLVQLGKMLRSIAGDHAFHTGNTNAQVFHSSALPNPADLLIAAVDALQRSITQRIPTLQEDDCAKLLNWDLLPTYAPMILMAQADHANRCAETALSGVVTGDNSLYQCALCNFRTDHLPAFRSHCTTSHAQRMYRTHDLPLHTHATDGLPTCKFCHQFFHGAVLDTTWSAAARPLSRDHLTALALHTRWPCPQALCLRDPWHRHQAQLP